MHRYAWYLTSIFIFFITNTGYCQSEKNYNDTINSLNDSTKFIGRNDSTLKADTLKVNASSLPDSLKKKDTLANTSDSVKKKSLEQTLGIKISKDALPSTVTATAEDSAVLDMEHNLFYLYKKTQVNYEDLQLNAGEVIYEQANNVVSAAPYEAAAKDTSEKQTFSQGKEKFSYDSLRYNFKSKRAIVRNVRTQYGEGYVRSEQVKRNPDQTFYGARSTYTTCALDTPHFGIVASKIKVIPGKLIISGPANLCIEGVPTPLYLPFGIFPISDKQKSGFVLPTYTIEQARGLGLLNGGYYYYINDYIDALAQANLYTKGSYAVSEMNNYRYMYHYSGTFRFSYAYNKTGEDFEPGASVTKDFRVNWAHQSDGKAVPGQTFNASVDAGTSTFYSNNSYDPNQILQNQYQSNITYSKNWQGKPFGLTISALHNQNTVNKQVNVTLPAINFHVTQLNPFQRRTEVGSHWYDKITTSYTVDMVNKTTFYDSTFSFRNISLNNMESGVHHSIPVSAAYTVLRYINMSFNVNYNEYWYKEKLYQQYDTIGDKVDTTFNRGFYSARDFNAGVSFSTRIYGMKLFKKGSLRGIRHVLTPSAGFTYHPDFGASPFNYYYRTHLDTPFLPTNYNYLSPFASSIIGIPPLGKAAAVNFGVNNNLQIKVRSSKDTVSGFKNITLIDGLGATASYNAAADSFRWSLVNLNFRTNVLDKINVSANAAYDPYAFDYQAGRRLQQTMEDKGLGLARFTGASASVGSNFHSKPLGGGKGPTNSEEYSRVIRNNGYNDYVDFNIPWSFNFSYSLTLGKQYSAFSKSDTSIVSQTLTFQGELQVTKRWKLNISSGYNFDFRQLTLTSIDVYRDLHCWAMHFQSVPFGPRKSYSFTINVKSAVLQDLKLMRRRDYRDAPY
jgi:hypothetical protein